MQIPRPLCRAIIEPARVDQRHGFPHDSNNDDDDGICKCFARSAINNAKRLVTKCAAWENQRKPDEKYQKKTKLATGCRAFVITANFPLAAIQWVHKSSPSLAHSLSLAPYVSPAPLPLPLSHSLELQLFQPLSINVKCFANLIWRLLKYKLCQANTCLGCPSLTCPPTSTHSPPSPAPPPCTAKKLSLICV